MWLRFNKDYEGWPKHGIVWVEDQKVAQKLVDDGICVRCTGPDGVAFGEASPEDVEAVKKAQSKKPSKKGK